MTIDELKDVLENVYPGNWDVQPIGKSNFTPAFSSSTSHVIVIKFPEIIIKNSNNNKHTIKDIFILLPIKVNPVKITTADIFGFRTTYTSDEYNSRYTHSHYPRHIPHINGICHFCLGDGNLRKLLNKSIGENLSEGLLENILYNIQSYLEWESLSGGPHIQMNNISNNIWASYNTYMTSSIVKEYSIRIIKKMSIEQLAKLLTTPLGTNNIIFTNAFTGYQVIDDEIVYCYIIDGDYRVKRKDSINDSKEDVIQNTNWYFKDEKVVVTITPSDKKSLDTSKFTKIINPSISDNIRCILNNNIKYFEVSLIQKNKKLIKNIRNLKSLK